MSYSCVLLFALKAQRRHDELGQESRGGGGGGSQGRRPEELSLKELPPPHPWQTGQGAGDGLSKQKQLLGAWEVGVCRGVCVRGPPRFGGCGPGWAFHAKRRDRLEHEVLIWGLESEFLEIFIIVLKLSVCLFILHKLFKDTCDRPPVF